MTGHQFAVLLQENASVPCSVNMIKRNPQQHKFIETVTVKLLHFKVELSHCRTIDYASLSSVRIGTPQEDALGRDFTINALFYNINEDLVEDFTNFGLLDLHNKYLRTPVTATKTLSEE